MPEIGDVLRETVTEYQIRGTPVRVTVREIYNPIAAKQATDFIVSCLVAKALRGELRQTEPSSQSA